MTESFVYAFEKIFEKLPKREFLKNPTNLISYMPDYGFDESQIKLLSSILSGNEEQLIKYLLGSINSESQYAALIPEFDSCGISSSCLLKDLKTAFDSNYRTDQVKTRKYGECRLSVDGKALYSLDMKTLLHVDDIVSISIPDCIVKISNNAFFNCRSLEEIDIPDSVTKIGSGAFMHCSSLKNVHIPYSVKSIDLFAFGYCGNAWFEVDERNEQYASENGALYDKKKETLISGPALIVNGICTIPNYVKNLEWLAFSSCTNLDTITIPKSVENLYPMTFHNCGRIFFNVDSENRIYSSENGVLFDKYKKTLLIGSSLVDEGLCEMPSFIEEIGERAFFGNKELIKACMSDNVKKIDDGAFEGCESLTEMCLSGSLTEIGPRTFQGCSSLERIEIPHSVDTISTEAFDGCTNLKGIFIPDSVESIDFEAFNGCISAKFDVERNDFFSSIHGALFDEDGSALFSGHPLVDNGTCFVPETVIEIHSCAFKGCTTLESIEIPDSVSAIRSSVFMGCTSLKDVHLPKKIDRISFCTFKGCTSLTEITIPDAVEKIQNEAFKDCTSLKKIHMPDTVSRIGNGAFQGCVSIETFKIPKRVKKIESMAFEGCTSLKEVTVPSSVSIIAMSAFENCESLVEIVIPASVQKIEFAAFRGCDSAYFYVDSANQRYTSIEGRLYDKIDSKFIDV